MSKKLKQQNSTQSTPKTKQPQLTSEERDNQRLLPLTITDTAPTGLTDVNEIQHTLFFLPKVAIKGPEITEEDAENMNEDDLYERFRIERTIVIYGTPVTYTESILQEIFETFGDIDSVIFHPTLDLLSRIAEITFNTDESYQTLFDTYHEATITINSLEIRSIQQQLLGLPKWDKQFITLRPDFTSLQNQVDLFMMAFDKRTADERKATKRPIVDSEGFTLVVGNTKSLEQSEKKFKQQNKQRKKKEEIKNKIRTDQQLSMYKIHEVEMNRKEQQELQRQSYADTKIIGKLKQQRSFNPF